MTTLRHWLVAALLSTGTFAVAQPGPPPHPRDHRHEPPPPHEAGEFPREAPPAPKTEAPPAPRAGFVFVPGHWIWKAGKWDWMTGRWEREHAGKKWSEGHWDHQGEKYVYSDGAWVDANAVPPAPTTTPPVPDGHPTMRDHRREWKLERPAVSSYWPVKGKVGSRIVIRGANFPADASVMWGGTQVTGAKVEADKIVFPVPAGATTGAITLKVGHGRDLAVGTFEVADYDAAAEAKRVEDAARAKAEAEWSERQKSFAKDQAARKAAFDKRQQERADTREQRRADREKEIRAKWEAAFLADPDTQSELTLHGQRVADIARMQDLADQTDNGKLAVRVGVAKTKEDARHDARMAALHDSFGRKP